MEGTGMGKHWDWGKMGCGHDRMGTQWDGKGWGYGCNGTGVQLEAGTMDGPHIDDVQGEIGFLEGHTGR